MSVGVAWFVLVACLALSVVSSNVLAVLVDRVGTRYRLPEGLLGIVTALGADSPEIAAAITAIAAGHGDVGVGIVLGSNIYNIAALLGLSAMVAGVIRIRRRALLLQATAALSVTAVGAALVLKVVGPLFSLVAVVVIMTPYLMLSSLSVKRVRRVVPDGAIQDLLVSALSDQEKSERSGETALAATRIDLMALLPVLVAVVLASLGMVRSAQTLGARYRVADVIVGTVVLAILTGIPNVLAAVRLARRGRGSAVISEALNSNSINIVAGLCVPAVIVGFGARTNDAVLETTWLLAMTSLAIILTSIRGGLRRREGLVIIAAYLAFLVVLVAVG